MSVQIILKNSSVEDRRPTANQLTKGEISLNYNETGAFLCCRDTDGNIQQSVASKLMKPHQRTSQRNAVVAAQQQHVFVMTVMLG